MKFEKFYDGLTPEQRKQFNKYQKQRQEERTMFTWVTCALGAAAMTTFMMYLYVLNMAGFTNKR